MIICGYRYAATIRRSPSYLRRMRWYLIIIYVIIYLWLSASLSTF
nr:MAG TPA: hypothetical protein [Caudoviricetes sp.]